MNTKDYVVVLRKGVNYQLFQQDLVSGTTGNQYMPHRPVAITNSRDAFDQITEYALTDEEATQLANDPRVLAVELPVEKNPDLIVIPTGVQNSNFSKTPVNVIYKTDASGKTILDPVTKLPIELKRVPAAIGTSVGTGAAISTGDNVNWGLARHSNNYNVYASTPNIPVNKYNYAFDGTGVDVVISDSGIQGDHPEFQNRLGVSRVQNLNWATYVPNLSSMGNPLQDLSGHGSNVAGITAGKTYGWAKNANIYSILATGTGAASPLDLIQAVKSWHIKKNTQGDPSYTGRPTVMNASWGLSYNYAIAVNIINSITSITYRSTTYPYNQIANPLSSYGVHTDLQSKLNGFPVRSAAVDTAIDDLISSGVIVCRAAGNNSYKIDVPDGPDYNNYLNSAFSPSTQFYYHKGSSPYSTQMIMVGNLDDVPYSDKTDQVSTYSCVGPAVDVFAAGTFILSAGTSSTLASNYNNQGVYFLNSNYKQFMDSGTSMASPQIAGMAALYLQLHPTATPSAVKSWIVGNADKNSLYSTGLSTDYDNNRSLQGSTGGIAYQALNGASFVKTDTANWSPVKAMFIKTNATTWTPVKQAYIKTDAVTWKPVY